MTIKLGKAAVGTYVRTGKTESSDREVFGFIPAGSSYATNRVGGYWDPVGYPRYILDTSPNSWEKFRTVKTKTYLKYARSMENA